MSLCHSEPVFQLAIHVILFSQPPSVSLPTDCTPSSTFIPSCLLPSYLSLPNIFTLSSFLFGHIGVTLVSPSHLRVLLVLLTLVVLTRSLAITEGKACNVVTAVLVQ